MTILLLLSGCAHKFMRGTVAMKLNEKKAHVCLGEDTVKTGDKLVFYSNKCTRTNAGSSRINADVDCEMKKLGEGTVSKILNSHYSEVNTDGTFSFKEGTLVQRIR